MTTWTGGYVADIPYTEGVYSQQTPGRMLLACLLGRVKLDMPAPDDPAHYLELGCGQGMGAVLMAAANPAWRITAIDYNPTHIAIGTSLARQAGLTNIQFLEADLSELAGSEAARAIPAADFVTMHGLWTWVSPTVRAGIVRLLADKVQPGGAVHVSYNALPAWQGGIGVQRLIYETGSRIATRSDRQAAAGIALARALGEAGGIHIADSKLAIDVLDRLGDTTAEYAAHEHMNACWAPAFHADVAKAMAQAKLEWVASADPLESFPELMLSEPQRALYDRYDDPIMRELIKDFCLERVFRHDVFVRGARRMTTAEQNAAISALTLTPIIAAEEMKTAIEAPAGTVQLGDALRGMLTALTKGPATIDQLLAQAPGQSNPRELIGSLVGTMQAQIVIRPGSTQPESANRLNRVLAARVGSLAGRHVSGGLASGQIGAWLSVPKLVQFIAGRLIAGEREDALPQWQKILGADIKDEQQEALKSVVEQAVSQRVPILRQLGIVPT